MKDWKRILSSVLVFCMLLSLGPAAFAAEDTNGRVLVGDGDTVTVGNVTVTTNGNAVWAYGGATVNVEGDVYQQAVDSEAEYNHINPVGASGSGSSSEVSVSGDVIGTSPAGTDVYAYALDGEASVSVEGDVIMDLEPAVTDENGGTGVYSYATGESGAAEVTIEGSLNVSGEASDAHGIQSYAQADYEVWNEESETYTWVDVTSSSSSSTVSVGGDVAVSAEGYVTGIEAAAEDGGTSVVTVDGTVNADILSSEESGSATGVYTNVEQASGTVEVTVGEDVLISGEASVSTGVAADVHASSTEWNEEAGEYLDTGLDSTTGTSDVTVGGDVTVFASDQATGIENHAAEGGVSTVTVEGSVYAEGNGEESADAIGVSSYAEDNGSSVVTVGEDVTVIAQNNADAVSAAVQNGGTSEISVGGDVELDMTPSEAYADSRIVSAAASGDSGSASVSVEGDISVSGNPDHVVGVSADAHGSYSYYDSEAGEFVYVEIDSTSASASVTVGGDVTVSGEYGATGVSAESSEGGTSEVTVEGDVSSDAGHGGANANSCGVDALANKDGVTNVTVGGGVTATLDAAVGTAHAVDVTAQDGGEAVVTLNGDVSADSSADAIGLGVFSTQDATASVTVNGDVSADGRFAQGVAVTAHSNAQADATVNGDVTASGEGETCAVGVGAYSDSSVTLILNGSVSAETSSDKASSTGLSIGAATQGSVNVTVNGDISADNALYIHTATPSDVVPKEVRVTVDGTISGSTSSIQFEGNAEDLTLTVWKVDLDEDGHAVTAVTRNSESDPDLSAEELDEMNAKSAEIAEQVEQNILYIIKLEQPTEGGTLSLGGTTKSDGYDVAKEGDNVTLYIAVADGYQVDGAYNGDGTQMALQKDSDGNYFLVVPRGGGVCLRAVMSLISVIEDITPEPEPEP
ncbi:MAG: hypothetical protein IJH48_05990, partial [Oscillospiraceae bacterium]|nr:hypothetical protein [Oscillospiraceae bacterium]